MQQYERFGVLALLLLVVTLVAVALLGEDPRSPEALAEATAAAEAQSRSARLQTPTPPGERAVPRIPSGDPRLRSTTPRPAPQAQERRSQRLADASAARRPAPQETAPPPCETPLPESASDEMVLPEAPRAERWQAPAPAPVAVEASMPRPSAPASSEQGPSEFRSYTVQPGDCLSRILERECGTVRALDRVLALNPSLDPDRIRLGQELRLPIASQSSSSPARAAIARIQDPVVRDVVRVREGDTLYALLKRERGGAVSLEEVLRSNPGLDPNRLQIGQELLLPRRSSDRVALPTGRYRVQPGDVLGRVALQLGCTLDELLAANPGLEPDRIVVGQELTLPAGAGLQVAAAVGSR